MPPHSAVAPPSRSRRSPDPFSRAKADGNGHGHHDVLGNGRDESRPSSGGSSVLSSDKSQKTNRMGLGHLVD